MDPATPPNIKYNHDRPAMDGLKARQMAWHLARPMEAQLKARPMNDLLWSHVVDLLLIRGIENNTTRTAGVVIEIEMNTETADVLSGPGSKLNKTVFHYYLRPCQALAQ
eukprot:scaffold1571_cov235-Chaetoceros_neogracile.AAC.3